MMTSQTLTAEIEELKAAYGEVTTAGAPGQSLYRIAKAGLPTGCTPAEGPVLLVLQDGQPPKVYAKPGIRTPNGTAPRSTSVVQVGGEEWMQFSYNLTGNPATYTLLQLVQASLQRFAKNE
jgi:hypothetical protein